MKPNIQFILNATLSFLGLFFYCEYVIYFLVLRDCDWPELEQSNIDHSIKPHNEDPVRVMVLADTHLLGSRNGHWFDKLRREWQMYRSFQTAMTLHQPDLIFVLGDLTDEGLYCSSSEFDYYVKRFYSLFAVPEGTKMYVAVGNHDIGFHYGISPYLNDRFVKAFNSPPVQLVTFRGNHFVLVNSMALEGDGCFLCRSAELQLSNIEKILKCTNGTYAGKCDGKKKLSLYSKPILMQHFPLHRETDIECTDYDAAPIAIKKNRFREKWDCLGREATHQLLNQLKPRLAVSGHVHHGCTKKLPIGDGLEVTLSSFSWRNKNNPTYGLFTFTPNNYAISKCAMPKESTIINLYIFGGSWLVLWLAFSVYMGTRRRKIKFVWGTSTV
ncbi:hypothetical protein Trydic_g12084 [Trypoxylus dichotomus]